MKPALPYLGSLLLAAGVYLVLKHEGAYALFDAIMNALPFLVGTGLLVPEWTLALIEKLTPWVDREGR